MLGGFLARSVGREPPHLQDPDRPEPPTPLVRAVRSRAPRRPLCGTAGTVRDHYVRYAAEGNVNYLVVNVPFGDMTFAEAERTLDAFIASRDARGTRRRQPLTALGGAAMPVSTRWVIRMWLPESSRIAASMP